MDTGNRNNSPGPGPGTRRPSRWQARILAFIQDYTSRQPHPPTLREIAESCDLSSNSVAAYNLRILERRKYLTLLPGAARGIVLTQQGRSRSPVPEDER